MGQDISNQGIFVDSWVISFVNICHVVGVQVWNRRSHSDLDEIQTTDSTWQEVDSVKKEQIAWHSKAGRRQRRWNEELGELYVDFDWGRLGQNTRHCRSRCDRSWPIRSVPAKRQSVECPWSYTQTGDALLIFAYICYVVALDFCHSVWMAGCYIVDCQTRNHSYLWFIGSIFLVIYSWNTLQCILKINRPKHHVWYEKYAT